mgnify:FL=1
MKVGDLVKALTGNYMSSNILAVDGKLGVIVNVKSGRQFPDRTLWQIVFINGAVMWLTNRELEIQSAGG